MSEPKNKNSKEWREWYVRRKILLNGVGLEMVKTTTKRGKNLNVLIKYLKDI